MITKEFTVTGRVQGVGFRYAVWQLARQLKITGSVKNELDGSVQIIAQGPQEDLEKFQVQLPQAASYARISAIQARELKNSDRFATFKVLY